MNKTIINDVEYRHYDHLYAVSKDGAVIKLSTLKPANPKLRSDGYFNVGRKRLLHRMVAICWLNQINNSKHVHHINGNKSDNRACNLEWVTPKAHRAIHGKTLFAHSESTKQKLRKARLGTTLLDQTKQKISASLKKLGHRPPSWEGKHHTKETILKMRQSSAKSTACCIHGIVYPSFSEAARANNEKPLTLRKRCLSKNFPDYQIA